MVLQILIYPIGNLPHPTPQFFHPAIMVPTTPPLPDAMGVAAKHSRGDFPLVFSTELARETSKTKIKLGHINARSNGDTIVMAQKKDKLSLKKTWYSYQLPFAGPFPEDH